ncbi:MAG: hypothetical protein F4Y16_16930 [Holophagales bacterium]|nr:hypothetical protein [Holophagales bacterium]
MPLPRKVLIPFACPTLLAFLAAPVAAAGDDDIPRTASGRPDLSGNYDVANLTPFERDPRLGDKQFMTAEEAERIAAGMAAADAVGGYNFFWLDFGNQAYPIDGQYRTSVLTDPPNGRMPELTEAGKARRATVNPYLYRNTGDAWWIEAGDDPYDGPETLTPGDRCIYTSVATTPVRSLPYNNLKTITQTDDHVVILVEWMHWAKVVRLNAEHPPAEYRSMGGDSIGWWEGDTLVVETTNFLDSQSDPRDGLKVIERFSRHGAKDLLYGFTVHDTDYAAPYSGELIWPGTGDLLYEYACHEGNYAMGNILRGARLLEKEYYEKQAQGASTGSGGD